MIIKEVANKYAEELAPEYQERFLQICKDELERTESHCEDYNDTIHNSINNSLTSLASKYINDNKETLIELMKDQINDCAKELSTEKISILIAASVKNELNKLLSNTNSNNESYLVDGYIV